MKKIILMVLFAIFSQGVFAQTFESAILTNPNHVGDKYKQLVRVYDENISVILSGDISGIYSFYYLKNGNSQTQKIQMPAVDTIHDFCILGNVVYFSGNNNVGA